MAAFQDFIKKNVAQNAGSVGRGLESGVLFDIANILTGQEKLKATGRLLRDLVAGTTLWKVTMAGAFLAMSKGVKALLHDTGSLDAALRKLAQIQGLQRTFAPLVGGAEAAKKKVAELVNFAAAKKLKLGDVSEAARSLEILTRGAYSGARALETIGDSAAASGNGISGIADAVGGFYNELRSGQPINAAAEQLRDMGAISGDTADQLVQLQQNGASNAQVFATLTGALEQARGGMKSLAADAASANAAFESAQTNLQEQFASPFTESDVENTKNWTSAMNAVAPAVARVAQFLQVLTGGFSTAKSSVARWAAENTAVRVVLEGLVYVLGSLIAVVSAVSALGLAAWLLGAAGACAALTGTVIALTGATGLLATAITAVGIALRVAMIATGIGIIIAVIGTAAGVIYNFVKSAERQRKALEDLRKAHDEANASMKRQIDAVKTLSDRHEALARALEEVTKAQEELNKAQAGGKPDEIAEAQRNLANAQQNLSKAGSIDANTLAPTDEEKEATRSSVARNRMLAEQAFRNEMETASPERQAELLRAKVAEMRGREESASAGQTARAKYSKEAANVADQVLQYQTAGVDVAGALDRQKALGLNAPKDSSVYAEAMARNTDNARERGNWMMYAEQRRQEEGDVPGISQQRSQYEAELAALEKVSALDKQRAASETDIAQLRSRGEQRAEQEYKTRRELINKEIEFEKAKAGGGSGVVLSRLRAERAALDTERARGREGFAVTQAAGAREIGEQEAGLRGDARAKQRLADLDVFAQKREELLGKGYDVAAANTLAQRFSQNAIAIDARNSALAFNNAVAASSLARIGGGGNVAQGESPLVDLAQRQVDALNDANQYLQTIADAVENGDGLTLD